MNGTLCNDPQIELIRKFRSQIPMKNVSGDNEAGEREGTVLSCYMSMTVNCFHINGQ